MIAIVVRLLKVAPRTRGSVAVPQLVNWSIFFCEKSSTLYLSSYLWMNCSMALRTDEVCWRAKLIFEDIMLTRSAIGSRIIIKERSMSSDADNAFFHLYLPVRMYIHFFSSTNIV